MQPRRRGQGPGKTERRLSANGSIDTRMTWSASTVRSSRTTTRPDAITRQGTARSLRGKAASVKILDLVKLMPDLPEKGDVSDFLARDGTVDQLNELAHETVEWTEPTAGEQPKPEPKEDQSHAGILKRIAATAELFKTPAGDGYATIRVNGRTEHHRVESRAIEDWLTFEFMEQVDRAPSGESLSQIVSTIKAESAILAGRDSGGDSRCT